MRVLHVTPSIAQSYGGPTNALAGYAVASRHADIQVAIASPRCDPADMDAFVSRAGDIELHLFPTFGSGAFVFSPALLRWVRRSAPSYDVVHVHGLFNPISSLSARAALRCGATVVIRPFGTLSRYTTHHRRTTLKRAYFRLVERRNLRDAAALHFTSPTELTGAEWQGIDFSGRSYVVPPPALGGLRVARPRAARRDAARILFLGRIVPVKNLESLLGAWQLVRRQMPSAVLEIAGDGDPAYVAALRRRAATLGIANSVVFRGFVSGATKDELLGSATLLVLPSLHENFGVVILEAIEAGVPVLISPEVQLADFVRREHVGRVAESEPEALAAAALDMIGVGGQELRNRVRDHGADIVASNFSPEAVGKLLSQMYRGAGERTGRLGQVVR